MLITFLQEVVCFIRLLSENIRRCIFSLKSVYSIAYITCISPTGSYKLHVVSWHEAIMRCRRKLKFTSWLTALWRICDIPRWLSRELPIQMSRINYSVHQHYFSDYQAFFKIWELENNNRDIQHRPRYRGTEVPRYRKVYLRLCRLERIANSKHKDFVEIRAQPFTVGGLFKVLS